MSEPPAEGHVKRFCDACGELTLTLLSQKPTGIEVVFERGGHPKSREHFDRAWECTNCGRVELVSN